MRRRGKGASVPAKANPKIGTGNKEWDRVWSEVVVKSLQS